MMMEWFDWVSNPQAWVMRLTNPIFTLMNHPFSGRDLILILVVYSYCIKAPPKCITTLRPMLTIRQKAYLYAAVGFSLAVEALNILLRSKEARLARKDRQ